MMIWKLLKLVLLIGVFFSSFAVIVNKFLPNKIGLVLVLYIIVFSSVLSGFAVYYEFYLKLKKHINKITEIVKDIKKINGKNTKRVYVLNELHLYKNQNWFLLEKSLEKIEEKIEKIEKQVMDKSMC